MGTTVLFVCTGNTCRSPMAEAIARHRLASLRGAGVVVGGVAGGGGSSEDGVVVMSAGVAASDGAVYSPEIVGALASVGAAAPVGGRSRALTRAMIASADRIYAMTASHARAVAQMDPGSADRVEVLDPGGRDVPDPIGGPASVYEATARALDEMIAERLAEWMDR